ncbi:efflux RND transporter periplasmic adaptor subunit [Sphingomonas sp.]|uniref:efflux RND transporter periplasmic adaptor subunit n=1 Tax=Sphingomonas sp. TaxID=28214 RepID=UPI002C02D5B5|nr:efflux RND transporter periplasmic adaptor subunit [Sphingomonas sp.]HWK35838.1 efflux RND transporter periplasmic adaptor subunit [Sphingomonas sp.]
MATTNTTELNDFLGVKPAPAWRRWIKWIVVAAVLLIAVLLLSRYVLGSSTAPRYETEAARQGNLTVTVSATGKLAPTNQVTVGSQLSGLVTQVVVDVNDQVKAGQALALIDPEQLDDQIRQGKASLAATQAQVGQQQATVAEARAQLNRMEEVSRLSGGKVPAKTEMETARANYQRALASLKAAQANVVAQQAQLAQSQTQRARAIIRSPVSGVVLARQVDPGQTVAASFNTPTLFVIAEDLSKMKLEVAIDEADVGQVKLGQKARFTVDAFPGQNFPALISRVDLGSNLTVSAATSSSTTSTTSTTGQVVSYAADLTVANPTLELRPGMTATADIVTTEKNNVLLVPNAALRFRPQTAATAAGGNSGITGALVMRPRRGGGQNERQVKTDRGAQQTIYIKGADGTPQAISITTGDTDGSVTEVTGGELKPGMEVITGQLSGNGDAAAKKGTRRSGGGGAGQQGGQQGGQRAQ